MYQRSVFFDKLQFSEVPLENFLTKNEKLCMPTISLSAIIK